MEAGFPAYSLAISLTIVNILHKKFANARNLHICLCGRYLFSKLLSFTIKPARMGGMLKVWRSNEEVAYGEGRRDGVREEVVSRDAFYLFTLEIMFSVVREERNMILKKLPGAFQGIVAKVNFYASTGCSLNIVFFRRF